MSTQTMSNNRICPACGHANASFSLFCAECGTSLSDAERHEDSSQTTALFTPVTDRSDTTGSFADEADDRYATQEFSPQPVLSSEDREDAMAGWYTATSSAPYASAPVLESRRGFWLGIIASILILLVIGFFAWSTLASDGFRDTFTGIF